MERNPNLFDKYAQCIRESLLAIFPIIMIGAFSLVFISFPIDSYTDFIQNFSGGIFYRIFNYTYQATLGALSIYMTISVSLSYCNCVERTRGYLLGSILSSLSAFFIFSGFFSSEDISLLSANGIFVAIVCGISASALFNKICQKFPFQAKIYSYGADDVFYNALKHIFPLFITIFVFLVLDFLIGIIFDADSFQALYVSLLDGLFHQLGRNFWSTLLYVFLIHLLWFFGIHGSNVFFSASDNIFAPAVEENIKMIASGGVATEIYSQTFLDVFVLMGGCGATFCLLIAIFILGKKRGMRNLAQLSIIPCIFNINELLVFGLPIVFNPIMIIPFFLTPIAAFLISTIATITGLVPIISTHVEWTTPVLFSGYIATGSISGTILQLVNLIIGVLIYMPFVRMLNAQSERNAEAKMKQLVSVIKESELSRKHVSLLSRRDDVGMLAKNLTDELLYNLKEKKPLVYYQPQFDKDHHCIGAEALMRWKHPVYGFIYPPAIFQLAEESNVLTELEKKIFQSVIGDMDLLLNCMGKNAKISINVTGTTIQNDDYEDFLSRMSRTYPEYTKNIMLEITEQASLTVDNEFVNRLTRIKNMGYRFAIDDFSMGNTSIKYLQTDIFSLLKLDGGLTRDIETNPRSRDIISSISKLSKEFDIQIMAEYVETENQRKVLEDMGCEWYQGYLYSPAIKPDELETLLNN